MNTNEHKSAGLTNASPAKHLAGDEPSLKDFASLT